MKYSVFISYSRQDSGYVKKLASALEERSFSVWIDDLIGYGSRWSREIQRSLESCSAFILVMTPRSFESDWVHNELSYAHELGKKIFPLLLEGSSSWLAVKSIQHTDVKGDILPPIHFYEQLRQYADVKGTTTLTTSTERTQQSAPFGRKLVFDSEEEKTPFCSWSQFSSVGGLDNRVKAYNSNQAEGNVLELESIGGESIGVEKSLDVLQGCVEFDYRVVSSKAKGPNIYYCMIPMQRPEPIGGELIEVGTTIQDHPNNQYSLFRIRYVVPLKHYGGSSWQRGSLEFDFRDTPTAFYSIFAPRINEGCPDKAPAQILLKNVRVFA